MPCRYHSDSLACAPLMAAAAAGPAPAKLGPSPLPAVAAAGMPRRAALLLHWRDDGVAGAAEAGWQQAALAQGWGSGVVVRCSVRAVLRAGQGADLSRA